MAKAPKAKKATVKGVAYLTERDDDGEAIYVHAKNCPSFCDYACNGNRGSKLADKIRNDELKKARKP